VTAVGLTRSDGSVVACRPTRLVVAGYTGRDRASVEEHIRELADAGIPPPERVPTYFELAPELARSTELIAPAGANTSGEVEPVLLFTEVGPLFAVGSDHTDRDLERDDVARSKAACPKLFSTTTLEYEHVVRDWDRCTVQSWAGESLYQDGTLAGIMPAPDTIADFTRVMGAPPEPGLVLFLGTIPLLRSIFEFTDSYRVCLAVPSGRALELSYRVLRRT
jgi:4-hydroxyphenylacetate 3-monooxygenase